MFKKTLIAAAAISLLFVCVATTEAVEIKPYGFILVNANYNTDDPSPDDIPVFAYETLPGEGGNFLITPRQTRFGLKITEDDTGRGMSLLAKIEMDFWGLTGSSSKGGVTQTAPRLRLAYMQLDWGDTKLTIGQNWIFFAPLSPSSLAHVSIPEFSSSGNLWARIPQVSIHQNWDFGTASNFTLDFGLLRPFGADEVAVSQTDLIGSGEESELPFLQARFAFGHEFDYGDFEVGLSAHYGEEESSVEGNDDLTTEAIALDLKVPFSHGAFLMELFSGKNLPMLFGMGSGVTARDTVDEIEVNTEGGFIAVNLMPTDLVALNFGYGYEELDEEDISVGTMQKNETFFFNIMYEIFDNAKIAFEWNHITTDTLAGVHPYTYTDAENDQFNFAVQYKF